MGWSFVSMAKRSSLANPMRRKRHEIQKRLQKARASCIRSRARGDIRGSGERNHETNGRTSGDVPGCVHSRRRGSACDSLQGDGQVRIVGMDSHGHKWTLMDAETVTYLYLLQTDAKSPSTCLLLERGVVLRYQSRENDGTRIATI